MAKFYIKKDRFKEFKRKHEKFGFLRSDGNLLVKFIESQIITISVINGYISVVDNITNRVIMPNKYHIKNFEEYVEVIEWEY